MTADFSIRAGDRNPVLVATLKNENGAPVDLTNANAAVLRMRRRDSTVMAINGAGMTILPPPTAGRAQYAWATNDTDVVDIGNYWATVDVTWNDGTPQSFPSPSFLSIEIVHDLASLPAISDEDLALIRAQIGATVPPTDIDLAVALARLGSAEAVAGEVLEARLSAMVLNAKGSIDGEVSWDNTAGIKVLSNQVGRLKTGNLSGAANGRLYRTDRER